MENNKRNNQQERRTNMDRDEEFAQDLAPTPPLGVTEREENRTENNARTAENGRGWGITSIVLSVLSFFLMPYLLAVAGIIVGIISVRRGSTLGWWGIAVGVVALIIVTIALPFRLLF